VIVANPKTAGVARWIFLALWGSKMKKGAAAAKEYVTKVGGSRQSWFQLANYTT
jgi:sulfate transport system substrate-binding protein